MRVCVCVCVYVFVRSFAGVLELYSFRVLPAQERIVVRLDKPADRCAQHLMSSTKATCPHAPSPVRALCPSNTASARRSWMS